MCVCVCLSRCLASTHASFRARFLSLSLSCFLTVKKQEKEKVKRYEGKVFLESSDIEGRENTHRHIHEKYQGQKRGRLNKKFQSSVHTQSDCKCVGERE